MVDFGKYQQHKIALEKAIIQFQDRWNETSDSFMQKQAILDLAKAHNHNPESLVNLQPFILIKCKWLNELDPDICSKTLFELWNNEQETFADEHQETAHPNPTYITDAKQKIEYHNQRAIYWKDRIWPLIQKNLHRPLKRQGNFPDIEHVIANYENDITHGEISDYEAIIVAKERIREYCNDNNLDDPFRENTMDRPKFFACINGESTADDVEEVLEVSLHAPIPAVEDMYDFLVSNGPRAIDGKKAKWGKSALKTWRDSLLRKEERENNLEEIDAKNAIPEQLPLTEQEIMNILGEDVFEKPLHHLKDTLDLAHVGDMRQKMLILLLIFGTYFGDTFQAILQGPAGTGKSHLVSTALKLMQRADYEEIAGATGPSLKRFLNEKGDILKLLVLKETGGIAQDDAIGALIIRLMSSDDKGGRFLACVREGDDYGIMDFNLPEHLSFITMNAGEQVNEQNESRMWVIECESGTKHNNRVVKESIFQDKFAAIEKESKFDLRVKAWQQAIIPLLTSFVGDVIVPFNAALEKLFVAKASPIARHAKKFLKLIEVITKIHAALDPETRACIEKDGTKYWVAESRDYQLACEVAWRIISGTIHHLKPLERVLIENLRGLADEAQKEIPVNIDKGKWQTTLDASKNDQSKNNFDGFTPQQICAYGDGVDLEYGRKRLRDLLKYGYITAAKTSKNGRVFKYLPVVDQDITREEVWRDSLLDITMQTQKYLKEHDFNHDILPSYSIGDE